MASNNMPYTIIAWLMLVYVASILKTMDVYIYFNKHNLTIIILSYFTHEYYRTFTKIKE